MNQASDLKIVVNPYQVPEQVEPFADGFLTKVLTQSPELLRNSQIFKKGSRHAKSFVDFDMGAYHHIYIDMVNKTLQSPLADVIRNIEARVVLRYISDEFVVRIKEILVDELAMGEGMIISVMDILDLKTGKVGQLGYCIQTVSDLIPLVDRYTTLYTTLFDISKLAPHLIDNHTLAVRLLELTKERMDILNYASLEIFPTADENLGFYHQQLIEAIDHVNTYVPKFNEFFRLYPTEFLFEYVK